MLTATAARRLSTGGLLLVVAAITTITPAGLRSFAEGPFPGYTGGFNEPTCQQCHIGNGLNDAAGTLELSVPPAFSPGKTYDITVTLERQALERGGFQLAARVAEGPSAGADAGRLHASTPGLQLIKGHGGKVTYVQHTPEGTRTGTPGSIAWTFRWTAPSESVPVRFDVAANASNNDESPLDDFVYARSVTVDSRQ
jgi:hypothetical protein